MNYGQEPTLIEASWKHRIEAEGEAKWQSYGFDINLNLVNGQALNKAGKACQGQTLQFIKKFVNSEKVL